jgi:hypothetical protein
MSRLANTAVTEALSQPGKKSSNRKTWPDIVASARTFSALKICRQVPDFLASEFLRALLRFSSSRSKFDF